MVLLEKGVIREMECGTNFAYILNDNSAFLSTEYKVLQSQWSSCFVRCMKMMYNGSVDLLYLTGNLKPLASIIENLSADNFVIIVTSIFENIIAVKNNGFLSCRNIDISFDKIFVDMTTYKVNFIYLPLKEHVFEDESIFDNEIRTNLVRLMMKLPSLMSTKTNQLISDLQNGSMSIVDLYIKLGGKSSTIRQMTNQESASYDNGDNGYQAQNMPSGANNYSQNAQNYGQNPAYSQNNAGYGQNSYSQGAPMNTGYVSGANQNGFAQPNRQSLVRMKLVGLNTPTPMEIEVTKPDFTIGKKEAEVDGAITFNKMISRVHCRISQRDGVCYAADLQSSNGTFVNQVKLQPNTPVQLNNGDVIRFANSDFRVVMM
ncbi:MAG: FHA domain-containing protein [Lachnospiraceae bacterium]|nr:FHA domain-containing protein [Lachnospiraceae bacterium]